MLTDLPYRQSLSKKEAVENIKDTTEKRFDPAVSEAFMDVLEEEQPPSGNP